MPEFTIELKRSPDNQHSLILWKRRDEKVFVVCSFYEPDRPIGSQWDWGHYFYSIDEAMKFWEREEIS